MKFHTFPYFPYLRRNPVKRLKNILFHSLHWLPRSQVQNPYVCLIAPYKPSRALRSTQGTLTKNTWTTLYAPQVCFPPGGMYFPFQSDLQTRSCLKTHLFRVRSLRLHLSRQNLKITVHSDTLTYKPRWYGWLNGLHGVREQLYVYRATDHCCLLHHPYNVMLDGNYYQ